MVLLTFTLVVVLVTAIRGIRSEQTNDVGHPVKARVTTSQVRVNLQSQGPSFNTSNTNQVFKTSLGAKSNGSFPQSTSSNELNIDVKNGLQAAAAPVAVLNSMTAQSSQSATAPPLIIDSTFAPSSRTYSAVVGTENPSPKTKITKSPSTSFLGVESTESPALIFGSQTIKVDHKNGHTLVDEQTPTPASTTTPGSDSSATSLALQTLPTQSQLVSDSSLLQPALIAAKSAVSKIPPVLTLNDQNTTANSSGQYNINSQTLTPGAVATVSGTVTSIAPKASDKVAAKSTNVPSTNTTEGSNSGPAGTTVQVFKGGVLGGRDGLWSSSIVLLVGIAVLLWL